MATSLDAPGPRVELGLFGRFSITVDREPLPMRGKRAQELLAYLLLNRDRVLSREVLAETLWGDGCSESRKTLRQVLWQVQTALSVAFSHPMVRTGNGFVGLSPDAEVHADVIQLEAAHRLARAAAQEPLDRPTAAALREAAAVYRGDLLPTCYADWCTIERDRHRAMYLTVLDRLMADAEATGAFASGLTYGEVILRHDRANERTHRRLMMLRYRNGDRTGAMRQFDECARALADELDVVPGAATCRLDGLIRRGDPLQDHLQVIDLVTLATSADPVARLHELHQTLRTACEQLGAALAALGDGHLDANRDAEQTVPRRG